MEHILIFGNEIYALLNLRDVQNVVLMREMKNLIFQDQWKWKLYWILTRNTEFARIFRIFVFCLQSYRETSILLICKSCTLKLYMCVPLWVVWELYANSKWNSIFKIAWAKRPSSRKYLKTHVSTNIPTDEKLRASSPLYQQLKQLCSENISIEKLT